MRFEDFVQYARRIKRAHPERMNEIWDVVSHTYDKISDDGVPAEVQIPKGIKEIELLVESLN